MCEEPSAVLRASTVDLAVLLADLPAPMQCTLQALYARQPQQGDDGLPHPIDATTRIKPEEGLELLALARQLGARNLLEVGLAWGFSSQFLLAALALEGGGRLVAIDPYQDSDWHGIGRRLAAASAEATIALGNGAFRWIGKRSDWALPQLEQEGARFDLVFIDGYHRFDDVLIDLSFAARLCRPGGLLVLHDMWLPSVRSVVAFIESNRPDLLRMPSPCPNLALFRREGEDQRRWDHFVPFESAVGHWEELS